jgi:hypothetical protein
VSYEVCFLCHIMHLTGDMRSVSLVDAETQKTMAARVCSSCMNQRHLYIAGNFAQGVEGHKDLVASAAVLAALVVICVFFGAILDGAFGLMIATGGIVAGAVALAGLVIASCIHCS